MENPCDKCITLSMCKGRATEHGVMSFVTWASISCSLFYDYISDSNDVNIERANEVGKLFGYKIIVERKAAYLISHKEKILSRIYEMDEMVARR